jgi:hypothetical protein
VGQLFRTLIALVGMDGGAFLHDMPNSRQSVVRKTSKPSPRTTPKRKKLNIFFIDI